MALILKKYYNVDVELLRGLQAKIDLFNDNFSSFLIKTE